MKYILYTISLFLFPIVLFSQSLSADFEVVNFQVDEDVMEQEHGTRGLLLSFNYRYKSAKVNLAPLVPSVSLFKNGMKVYADETSILLLSTNESELKQAFVFLPYRDINLLNGAQQKIALKVELKGLMRYETNVNFFQPTRYIVEVDLKGGAVKQKLKQYDESNNPKEWLPDSYYTFTSNGGSKAIYTSRVHANSYDLKPEKLKFHLLEGEQLYWSFYDRDGSKDQKLGVFDKISASGDYSDEFYGEMFGDIRNLEFSYSQRAQARQAISIYSDPTYKYKNKKGVAITVEYDLAKAYIGEQAAIHLYGYTENGIRLDIGPFYAIEETPEVGTQIDLKTKGRLKYFIPFYNWDNNCRAVEFYFEMKDKQQINAARHSLLSPIVFDDLVIDSGMKVEENVAYQGTRGIKISLHYELLNDPKDLPLRVKFMNEDGTPTNLQFYHIIGNGISTAVGSEHLTKNPRIADRMQYFIPYASISKEKLKVQMDLIPDVAINIFKKTTPLLVRQAGKGDVTLELVSAGGRFRADNYGQVLDLKLEVPKFFLNKVKLELEVTKDGKKTSGFLMDGYFNSNTNDYSLKQDSGRLYIVFPHRNASPGSTYEVRAHVLFQNKTSMSDSIYWKWTAPKELFNRNVEIAVSACRYDKKILQDTSVKNELPWFYVVEAGGEVLVKEPLVKNFSGKVKDQFKQKLFVNREDNIIVKLVHKKKKSKVVLWRGDLGKWGQKGYKAQKDNAYPVKMIKVNAKVIENTEKKKGII